MTELSLSILLLKTDYNGKLDQAKWKVPGVLDLIRICKTMQATLPNHSVISSTVNIFIPSTMKSIRKVSADKVLYKSDPAKLYFSDYLVFDSGTFNLNPLTNYPLMGMGERSGSLFYKDE